MTASSNYTTVVNVLIEQHREDRMFSITSKDVPGLFLAGSDLHKLLGEVPASIKMLYKANYGMDVEVLPATTRTVNDGLQEGWTPIPNQFVALPVAQQFS